jgi:hypothetical protein
MFTQTGYICISNECMKLVHDKTVKGTSMHNMKLEYINCLSNVVEFCVASWQCMSDFSSKEVVLDTMLNLLTPTMTVHTVGL